MKLTHNLKFILIAGLFFLPLSAPRAAEDYNPDLLIFAGELRNYVQKATELAGIPEANNELRSEIVTEMQATAKRLGRVYFSETSEVIGSELNKHLAAAIKGNSAIKNYFVFLGNAFSEEAAKLVDRYKAKQKQIRTYSIMGGAALGLLVGGGYLFIKVKNATTAALAGKDYAIAAGAVLAGTAIGFGVGSVYSSKLPMDNSIKNAKDFATRYPHGEDFINSLDLSKDLALLRSSLN